MIVLVRFKVKAGHEKAFRERVIRQATESLAMEPACRLFDVAVKPDDASEILLYEIYDSAADFDAHLGMDHFQQFSGDVASIVESKTVEIWDGPVA